MTTNPTTTTYDVLGVSIPASLRAEADAMIVRLNEAAEGLRATAAEAAALLLRADDLARAACEAVPGGEDRACADDAMHQVVTFLTGGADLHLAMHDLSVMVDPDTILGDRALDRQIAAIVAEHEDRA